MVYVCNLSPKVCSVVLNRVFELPFEFFGNIGVPVKPNIK